MADDLKPSSKRDDSRIDVSQEQELKYWSEQFGVTQDEIREAVKTVGPMVHDVRRKLSANRSY